MEYAKLCMSMRLATPAIRQSRASIGGFALSMPAQIAQFGASDEARPEDDLLSIAAGTALGVGVCELRKAAQSLLNGLTPDRGQ